MKKVFQQSSERFTISLLIHNLKSIESQERVISIASQSNLENFQEAISAFYI